MTDVCECSIRKSNKVDKTCACPQMEVYAQQCIDKGVDVSDWRNSVDFCPFECPSGQVYNSAGSTPVPTCLDRNPTPTGTVRGCYCPAGQFLQDGRCINANQCKCLYE